MSVKPNSHLETALGADQSNTPAFPSHHDDEYGYSSKGMSLRDYFAAKAVEGLVLLGDKLQDFELAPDVPLAKVVASQAYTIADAMLEARK